MTYYILSLYISCIMSLRTSAQDQCVQYTCKCSGEEDWFGGNHFHFCSAVKKDTFRLTSQITTIYICHWTTVSIFRLMYLKCRKNWNSLLIVLVFSPRTHRCYFYITASSSASLAQAWAQFPQKHEKRAKQKVYPDPYSPPRPPQSSSSSPHLTCLVRALHLLSPLPSIPSVHLSQRWSLGSHTSVSPPFKIPHCCCPPNLCWRTVGRAREADRRK